MKVVCICNPSAGEAVTGDLCGWLGSLYSQIGEHQPQ